MVDEKQCLHQFAICLKYYEIYYRDDFYSKLVEAKNKNALG